VNVQMQLTHVAQRKNNDCAIATVATAANLPYDQVAQRSISVRSHGLGPFEMRRLLVTTTGVPWSMPRYGWLRPIEDFAREPRPVIVMMRRPWRWTTLHWLAVQGGWRS
jgi:hypothetical protein